MARRYTCLPTLCCKLNESGWPNWSERSWHRSKEFHPRFMRCPLLTSDRLIFCHEVNLKFGMPNYLLKGCAPLQVIHNSTRNEISMLSCQDGGDNVLMILRRRRMMSLKFMDVSTSGQ